MAVYECSELCEYSILLLDTRTNEMTTLSFPNFLALDECPSMMAVIDHQMRSSATRP